MNASEQDKQPPALDFTGERFTPECVREIFHEHMHRYAWAQRLVGGLDVLDCACGEGYGSRILADSARSVTGVDIDSASIEHARRRYAADGLEFARASALDLPFEDDRFDVATATCVFCSVADPVRGLRELARVVRPEGRVLLLEHLRPRTRVLGLRWPTWSVR
jgi:ubiquinone/menaquinone biosynthesis C-methylase UbiE